LDDLTDVPRGLVTVTSTVPEPGGEVTVNSVEELLSIRAVFLPK
jgi:hypothetical protein